jgi:hypothetical protein
MVFATRSGLSKNARPTAVNMMLEERAFLKQLVVVLSGLEAAYAELKSLGWHAFDAERRRHAAFHVYATMLRMVPPPRKHATHFPRQQ